MVFVGIAVDWQGYRIGLAVTRAQWLQKWLDTQLRQGWVSLQEFSAVLGRLSFVSSAQNHGGYFITKPVRLI